MLGGGGSFYKFILFTVTRHGDIALNRSHIAPLMHFESFHVNKIIFSYTHVHQDLSPFHVMRVKDIRSNWEVNGIQRHLKYRLFLSLLRIILHVFWIWIKNAMEFSKQKHCLYLLNYFEINTFLNIRNHQYHCPSICLNNMPTIYVFLRCTHILLMLKE